MYLNYCRVTLKHSKSLRSQAASGNAPLTFTSVAAVNAWTPAWCATASPTAPTAQTRAWGVLNATAPADRLRGATTTVSAPRTGRSVQNTCARGLFFCPMPSALLCPKLNLGMRNISALFAFKCASSSSLLGLKNALLPHSRRGVTARQVSNYSPVLCPVWTLTSAMKCRVTHANTPA